MFRQGTLTCSSCSATAERPQPCISGTYLQLTILVITQRSSFRILIVNKPSLEKSLVALWRLLIQPAAFHTTRAQCLLCLALRLLCRLARRQFFCSSLLRTNAVPSALRVIACEAIHTWCPLTALCAACSSSRAILSASIAAYHSQLTRVTGMY
jgi:hypothetical protein